MTRKPKRYKSSSEERRYKQDFQAFLIYVILSVVGLTGWLCEGVHDICIGALQGVISPLIIITLRYCFRITNGQRMDSMGLVTALLFIIAFVLIAYFCWPHSLWQYSMTFLSLVATVFGIQKFRFSPVFMLLNCLVAGAFLLP